MASTACRASSADRARRGAPSAGRAPRRLEVAPLRPAVPAQDRQIVERAAGAVEADHAVEVFGIVDAPPAPTLHLVEGGDVASFRKAFSGSVLTEDSHLITWLPVSNRGPNKKELFYFLYVLGIKKLIVAAIPIEKNATELYERIRRVFADGNGIPIVKGIKQSFLDFNKERKNNLPSKVYENFSETKSRAVVNDFRNEMTKSIIKNHDNPAESFNELNKLLNPPVNKYEDKYNRIVLKAIAVK